MFGTISTGYTKTKKNVWSYTAILFLCILISSPAFGVIYINGHSIICKGTTTTMSTYYPGGRWSISNPAICTIDSLSGALTGVNAGTAIITYVLGTATSTRDITITTSAPDIYNHEPVICRRAGTNYYSHTGGGRFYSSNSAIATVDSITGQAIGVSGGTAIITYNSGSACGTAAIGLTVRPYSAPVLTGDATLCRSQTAAFTSDITTGYWRSTENATDIDSVTGVVRPIAVGNDWISFNTTDGCSSNVFLTVSLDAFAMSGPSSACAGSSILLSSGGDYSHFWRSSDTSVAAVLNAGVNGIVTGVAPGTAIITYATQNNCIATRTVTISAATCTGTPTAGTTTFRTGGLTSGSADTLMLTGHSTCGSILQWQDSPDGTTWTDLPRGNVAPLRINPLTSANYRCKVKCVSSGLVSYSNTVFIPKTYTITGHSVLATPSTSCTPSRFCISASGVSNTLNAITNYGDGASDTMTLSSSTACNAIFTHDYLLPGVYTVKHIIRSGAFPFDSVSFSYDNQYCKMLPIRFFYDRNNNALFDYGEDLYPIVARTRVDSNGIPIDTISSVGGFYYRAKGPAGTIYKFSVLSEYNYIVTAPSTGILSDTITAIVNNYPTKYFGISCGTIPSAFDLRANAGINTKRRFVRGIIRVDNISCGIAAPVVALTFSPRLAFASSLPSPDSVVGNVAYWHFDPINYFRQVGIDYNLIPRDSILTIGDTLQTKIKVYPLSGDIDTNSNKITRDDIVRSGYDPNTMEVSPDGQILPCTELTYTVHFENTGNDTAYNVHVMDTLPPYVDVRTLRMVYASAPMNVVSSTWSGQNVLKFDFPNIKLWDSSHRDKNNGMFVFKVKVKPGLADGIVIPNRAGIYFDDNEVVLTNTAVNTIGMAPIAGVDTICTAASTQLLCASAGGVWSASNANATVIEGLVRGVTAGRDTISYTITTGCATRTRTKMITIKQQVTPNITIVRPILPLCPDSLATFNTSIVNGGPSPAIRWKVNGTNVGAGTAHTYRPANNDILTATLTNTDMCASPQVVTDRDTIHVAPLPAILSVTGPDSVCTGAHITLLCATPGGIWTATNGNATVDTGIVRGIYAGKDTIRYTVTTTCATRTAVKTITINQSVTPHISIVSPGLPLCADSTFTFSAHIDNGGIAPVIKWKVNGADADTGASYTYTPANNDIITATLTNNDVCASPRVVTDADTLSTIAIPDVQPITGPDTVCRGATILLQSASPGGIWTASNANATVNEGTVSGITPGKDTIIYTISTPCASRSSAKEVTILPVLTPAVSINQPTIAPCAGNPITLTTTIVNGGAAPIITWKVNGTNTIAGQEYTYTPNNRDIVTVTATSTLKCLSTATAKDVDTIAVTALPTLSVADKLGGNIEAGKTDTFTATGNSLGQYPTYQWHINSRDISGATNSVFVTNQLANGDTVMCVATASGSCTGYTATAAMAVIVTQPTIWPASPTLTPNPNKGLFTIKGHIGGQTYTGDAHIVIKNAVGQTQYTSTVAVTNGIINETLQLSGSVARGVYVATVIANGATSNIKFVVE